MCGHHGQVAVGGKVNDLAGAGRGHGGHHGVGGVQDAIAIRCHVLHDDPFDQRQVFYRVDKAHAQMVAFANVGHHGYLAAVKAQAFAQNAAARGFKHGSIDFRVQQHIARAFGAGAIAVVNLAAVHVHTIGIGHAHPHTGSRKKMRDQACGGGFAIGAGDRHHGNAPIVAGRKHQIHHGLANRARLAIRGCQMHAQAGRGVDFHNAAVLFLNGQQHAFADQIDAANVQAHHLRRGHSARRYVGVYIVGHVGSRAAGGQVGIAAQNDALAFGGYGIGRQTLVGQARQRNVVQTNFGQWRGVAIAPARVQVDQGYQFAHGVNVVAQHLRRFAPRCGHQLVAHHQQAEIMPWQKAFHHHFAVFGSGAKGFVQLGALGDIDSHAFALVAVLRLDHHG